MAAIVARLQGQAMGCSPLKSTFSILLCSTKLWDQSVEFLGNYETNLSSFWPINCWTFLVLFCGLCWYLHWIYMGISFDIGGQAWMSCMLGSGLLKILFWSFVLCSLGASRCYYLGMVDSHLLLRQSGSKCYDTTLTWVKPSVTDFTQVWVPRGSTSPLHLRAAALLVQHDSRYSTEYLS